jgi:hypothetical protein
MQYPGQSFGDLDITGQSPWQRVLVGNHPQGIGGRPAGTQQSEVVRSPHWANDEFLEGQVCPQVLEVLAAARVVGLLVGQVRQIHRLAWAEHMGPGWLDALAHFQQPTVHRGYLEEGAWSRQFQVTGIGMDIQFRKQLAFLVLAKTAKVSAERSWCWRIGHSLHRAYSGCWDPDESASAWAKLQGTPNGPGLVRPAALLVHLHNRPGPAEIMGESAGRDYPGYRVRQRVFNVLDLGAGRCRPWCGLVVYPCPAFGAGGTRQDLVFEPADVALDGGQAPVPLSHHFLGEAPA